MAHIVVKTGGGSGKEEKKLDCGSSSRDSANSGDIQVKNSHQALGLTLGLYRFASCRVAFWQRTHIHPFSIHSDFYMAWQ
jgi:hypothetical protein